MRYIGHVFRGNSLEKDCLLGMVRGGEQEGDKERVIWMEVRLCWDAMMLEKFCGCLRGEKYGVSLSPTSTKTRHFGKGRVELVSLYFDPRPP